MICAYLDKISKIGLPNLQLEEVCLFPGKRKTPSPKSKEESRKLIVWTPSEAGFVKINFDGSKLANGQTTFAFIIRDETGILKLCGDGALSSSESILVVEARGLREGIRGALSLGVRKVIILAVIQANKNIWKIPWTINAIVLDAGEDLKRFEEVQIQHIYREANDAAHWLAQRSHSTTNLTYWL